MPEAVAAFSRLNDVKVAWSWPAGSNISAVLVEGSPDGGSTWLSAVVEGGSSAVYVYVPWETTWNFRVSGINSAGVGPFKVADQTVGRSEITLDYTNQGVNVLKNGSFYEVSFSGDNSGYMDFSPSRECKIYIEEFGGSGYIIEITIVNSPYVWHVVAADTYEPDPANRPPHYMGGGTGWVLYEGQQYRLQVQNGLWASLKFQPEDLMDFPIVTLS